MLWGVVKRKKEQAAKSCFSFKVIRLVYIKIKKDALQ
jgi:hypothetical protein